MNLKTLQEIMSATDIHPEEVLLVAADACEEMSLYEVAERFRQLYDLKALNTAFTEWRRVICEERLWLFSEDTGDAFHQWNDFITEHKRLHQNP